MKFKEIDGDIFEYIDTGEYDVVIHGCNCFSTQKSGIAYPMNQRFNTENYYMERANHPFNIDENTRYNKLGCIEWEDNPILLGKTIAVTNCYTQYHPGKNGDYHALFLCLKKINFYFKGKNLITPLIGGGIAGLDRDVIIRYMKHALKDLNTVTLVNYKK